MVLTRKSLISRILACRMFGATNYISMIVYQKVSNFIKIKLKSAKITSLPFIYANFSFEHFWLFLISKTTRVLVAVYGSLLMIFALVLEISCFIIEAGGFTVPLFVKLFRRYSVLHFFSVSLIMISAGLWFAFSESLVQELSSYPRFRGSKVHQKYG